MGSEVRATVCTSLTSSQPTALLISGHAIAGTQLPEEEAVGGAGADGADGGDTAMLDAGAGAAAVAGVSAAAEAPAALAPAGTAEGEEDIGGAGPSGAPERRRNQFEGFCPFPPLFAQCSFYYPS